jgi:hypothetical protein
VEDRSKVYVFNFDQMRPDEKAVLSHDSQCDQRGKPIEDNDFKWLYQLIAPPNQLSLADWLATSPFPNKRLPAPLSQCPGPDEVRTTSPDTSTCFFRTWDEDL